MKFVSPTPDATPPGPIVIRPQRRVLVRKIVGLGLLLAVFGVLPTVLSQLTREDASPRNYLPGFALLCGMMGLHLLFLSRALFVTLNRHAEIRVLETGLEIALDDQVRQVTWQQIRAIRFGDIHLVITTAEEKLEIPFIDQDDQRLLYRLHYRQTGLTPDSGRFLATSRPNR